MLPEGVMTADELASPGGRYRQQRGRSYGVPGGQVGPRKPSPFDRTSGKGTQKGKQLRGMGEAERERDLSLLRKLLGSLDDRRREGLGDIYAEPRERSPVLAI